MTKNNEDENLKRCKEEKYGYKKNGEMYKTTKYQREYQKQKNKWTTTKRMKNETIYFQVEGNDDYGNLTLPTGILNELVGKSKEVILSFTFHEESDKDIGQVSINFIPIGGEEKQESHKGKMLVEKKIVFGIPKLEKEK